MVSRPLRGFSVIFSMAISTTKPTREHTALIFGPQFLFFTVESLIQLRSQCQESSGLHDWLLDIFTQLPSHWAIISSALPFLEHLPGKRLLEDVYNSIRTGNPPKTSFPLPNFLLCPLVIVLHLTEYIRYQEIVKFERGQDWLSGGDVESLEVVGFCTGLLSAFAVSLSTNRQDLERYGTIAVRLAMLIGAIVDSQNIAESKSNSVSASWQDQDGKAQLYRILKTYPKVTWIPPLSKLIMQC